MFRVIYRDLRHQITTKTSQTLHFNVFGGFIVQNHQNPFLKSISNISKSTNQHSFTVDYLINSCGLPPEKAFSVAKKFNLCSIEKADSVISLFQSYGITKTHITRIISQQPHLLTVDPNKILKPKFEFLSDLGISPTDISKFLPCNVAFLASSLQNRIIPCFNILRRFIANDVDILNVLKRWIINANLEKVLIPNISILQVHGVPDYNISKMLFTHPRTLCVNSKRFKVIVEEVKKLGFDPLSPMFYIAVRTMTGISKSIWDKKLMVYQEFGWSENAVISAFKKQPDCMKISEKKIREAMEFFLKKVKCKPTAISICPALLQYSLDKRIVPRCSVLKILYLNGLISKKLNLGTVSKMGERDFLKQFVTMYQETVPEVIKAYKGEIEFEGFGEVVDVKDLSLEPVIDHIMPVLTAV